MISLDKNVDLIKQQKHLFQKIFSKKDNIWKVIIFDQPNHDIISSLYKLKDFRENNITLYFNIKTPRQQLHGVTAIYLVKPINQNIQLIVNDFQNDLYSSVAIHFTSQPAALILSTLAKNLSKKKSSSISKIQKIQYSNVGFQCIDRHMCILPEVSELLNLISTLKNQPIFIYSSNEQNFVQVLKERFIGSSFGLNKNKNQQISMTQLKKTKKYTKVLIFNRQTDLFPIIGHGITYGSLMEDIHKFNRLGNRIIDKQHQLDLNDEIWLDKKNMLISEMQLQKQCNKIKNKLLNLNNKMEEFSELTQKNKKIQWHLSNAEEMIMEAKERRLNQFHSVQEDMHTKKMLTKQSKNEFVELLQSSCKKEDKVRLMLSYLLSIQNYDQNQVQELQKIFPDILKNNFYNQTKSKKSKKESQQGANSKYIKKLAKGLWQNLVNQQKKYLLIKYLQKTKDFSSKNLNQLGLQALSFGQIPLNAQIQKSVVYVLGGINFNQYCNLSQFDANVLYAGDKFINYREFI